MRVGGLVRACALWFDGDKLSLVIMMMLVVVVVVVEEVEKEEEEVVETQCLCS